MDRGIERGATFLSSLNVADRIFVLSGGFLKVEYCSVEKNEGRNQNVPVSQKLEFRDWKAKNNN
jgi:hypothetical protein